MDYADDSLHEASQLRRCVQSLEPREPRDPRVVDYALLRLHQPVARMVLRQLRVGVLLVDSVVVAAGKGLAALDQTECLHSQLLAGMVWDEARDVAPSFALVLPMARIHKRTVAYTVRSATGGERGPPACSVVVEPANELLHMQRSGRPEDRHRGNAWHRACAQEEVVS